MADLFRSMMGGQSDGLVGSVVEAGQHRLNVTKKVAEGGFAIVYKATNEMSGQTVAIKRLLSSDPGRKKEVIREAGLLKKMNHKNIVGFVTAAQVGKNAAGYDELLVVMEWCPIQVTDLMKDRGGFLNRKETTKVMYQAASAIGALHKLNPPHIHRDIKGENLLLTQGGIVKLCDFGIEEDSQRCTTPAYRAPEICDLYSNFPIDKRQDLWAMGCLLILLTTGKHPFELGEKLAIINGRYAPSSNPEHAPFASIVKKLLVLDPRNRCGNIPDLMDTLRAVADNCNIDGSEAITPLPARAESPPKFSPTPSPEQGMSNSSSFGDQAGSALNKAAKIGSGLFSKLKSGINEAVGSATEYAEKQGWDHQLRKNGINIPRSGPKHSQAPQEFNPYSDFNEQGRDEPSYQTFDPDPEPVAKQPERKAPAPAQEANFFDTLDWDAAPKAAEAPAAATPAPAAAPVADLLGGMSAAPSQAPAQPVQSSDNYDPFSQWEKKTPTNNNTPNAFDPMAPAGAGASRANFSNIQQPQQTQQAYDPFANLTSMGSSLPKPTMNNSQPPRPQQQQQASVNNMAGGAWGATFQTRPAANPGQASGGWNPNAYMQTNVNAYKQQQARVQQPPPQSNSQAPAAKKGGAFDDLLSGFGNIGQKSAEKNRKMGDMKRETENKYRDPIDVKVETWAKGKEANVRALIASLQEVLWEGNSWKPISVGEILQPVAVKKSYRRACLVVHPDKHTGGENEKLARAIFMQLSESYTKFEENPSM
ncbi:unnamed protein product [Oikopleura dioica]|uniref:Protein kinase domain-containing protein n=1 Tax=Oikopleura dioica TaxID=34765 RepID=E4YFP7_OIKDI|nr:unnamed protein product [Oikopleura dioica]